MFIATAAFSIFLQIQGPPAPGPVGGQVVPTTRAANMPTREQLEQRLAEKLNAEFLKKAPWITDYEAALAAAAKTGHLIFAYFTRSDVEYAGCRVTETGLLLDPKFAEFSKDLVLYCHVTSGIAERKHEGLLKEKAGAGFPTILFLSPTGEVVYRHQAARTIDGLVASARTAREFFELEKQANSGDSEARLRFIMKQHESSPIRNAELLERLKDLKNLSPASQKQLEELQFEIELDELYKNARGKEENMTEAAQKVLAWYDQKRVPQRERAIDYYFGILTDYARSRKDVKIFELVVEERVKRAGNDARKKAIVESLNKQLDHIKKLARSEELHKKYSAGDRSIARELLVLDLSIGQITFAQASELLKDSGKLDAEEEKKIQEQMIDLELREIMNVARDRDSLKTAGARVLEMHKNGRVPTSSDGFQRFWIFVVNYGSTVGDEEAMNVAIGELKKRAEKDANTVPLLQMAERRLADLQKKKPGPAARPSDQK